MGAAMGTMVGTVVSTVMCIPFMRSSRIRRLPWRCRSLTILEQTMAMRKRDDDLVFPNAAGIDVGGSSHWVADDTFMPRTFVPEKLTSGVWQYTVAKFLEIT